MGGGGFANEVTVIGIHFFEAPATCFREASPVISSGRAGVLARLFERSSLARKLFRRRGDLLAGVTTHHS
jgi:hypothetical protein